MKKQIAAWSAVLAMATLAVAVQAENTALTEIKAATQRSMMFAARARSAVADDGFKKFKASVYKEPFPGGVYIVNGDTPISNEHDLEEFYRFEISAEWKHLKFGVPLNNVQLVVNAPHGVPATWDNVAKKKLTYCVSTTFGANHAAVVNAMKAATAAWEAVSDVKFAHLASSDASCNASTQAVMFDVRPVNVNGAYLARAFFPRSPRGERNVLIDQTSFALPPAGKLQLTGILRHELGHVLAFRHEQTRPEAGKCFEDNDWKPLTSYDAFSVMHYPQCNGLGDWALQLTDKDKVGAACLYGLPAGVAMDAAQCDGKF